MGAAPASSNSINSWSGYKTNINCGQPAKNALKVLPNGNLISTVRHGEIGKCKTDPYPYVGPGWSKPHSERAELVIKKKLNLDRTYTIRFDAKIIEGFIETGRNENFFQIKGCASSNGVSVLGFLRRRHSQQFAFYLGGGGFTKASSPVSLVANKWFKFEITYRNGKQASLSMSIDGKPIVQNVTFKRNKDCGRNRLRLGIYRGGSKTETLTTSSMEYRSLRIEQQ
ncbi:MAG: heparin lyase I family protein [Lentilitoribacter sp.]